MLLVLFLELSNCEEIGLYLSIEQGGGVIVYLCRYLLAQLCMCISRMYMHGLIDICSYGGQQKHTICDNYGIYAKQFKAYWGHLSWSVYIYVYSQCVSLVLPFMYLEELLYVHSITTQGWSMQVYAMFRIHIACYLV